MALQAIIIEQHHNPCQIAKCQIWLPHKDFSITKTLQYTSFWFTIDIIIYITYC